ncbi:hypothetical protein ACS0TY_007976 [Phlomoides rotata]
MEFRANCGEESTDRKTSKVNTCLSSQAKQRNKLGSILNVDKCERIDDDFHPQVLHYADKCKGLQQKQQVERKSQKSEELVMYMSCLPGYLERGENSQEKHFSIGVLDWGLLQKWQHNSNDVVGINTEHSSSTSNSASISSKGSSSYCSSDNTGTRSRPFEKDGTVSGLKGKDVIHKGEAKKAEKQVPISAVADCDFYERRKTSPNLEKINSGSKPRNVAENENLQMKVCASESIKVRNPSPTRRFSFGIGRIGKSSHANSSATANLVSPDSKVTSISACSNSDKTNATSRARSSPLRRLLDPILNPKGIESHDVSRSSERNPSKMDKALKSSSGQTNFPALLSAERTSDLKNGALRMHALLQVAMKNGLPLFTFTVDNCSDILAATVKELSPSKTTSRWIYTFFSFTETKRKNSGHWINQGSKDRNHGYIPNIIAQMKVSDILHSDSTGNCVSRREFVLSSVGAGGVNQSFLGNELAAIVVKFPERMLVQRVAFDIPQARSCSTSGDESASDELFSTTVILPGGHHGAPSKGEPSPLIERWKTGGLCDCGGWDLGCRLRTLTNRNESNHTKSQLADFKLFSQEEVEDQRPVFILSPFEDGMFSVEFSSSLKLVQSFSVGIAVVHSQTSAIVSSSNVFGGTMSEEITVSKIFNQAQLEVPAKYAANPPLSPVGRV